MAGKKITTHEATVQTATVEVKTLTISGRQVTLSVFRQLQRADLIDTASMKLNGVPWGSVNYFWPGAEKPTARAIHVVWQLGAELRRSIVCPTWSEYEKEAMGVRGLERCLRDWRAIFAGLSAIENPAAVRFVPAGKPIPDSWGGTNPLHGVYHVAGWVCRFDRDTDTRHAVRTVADIVGDRDTPPRPSPYSKPPTPEQQAKRWRADLERAYEVRDHFGVESLTTAEAATEIRDEYQESYDDARRKLEQREGAYRDLFAGLLALPQLFIAT